MVKYIVENEINFYEELKKSLKSNEEKLEKYCLITNDILIDKYIDLDCGHCFNYIPLWNEIYNQKFCQSFHKTTNIKDSIQCPYCRKIHYHLLPYYPEFNLKNAYGVTTNEEKYKISLINNNWVYINTIKYFYGICCYVNEDNVQCDKTNVLLYENKNQTYCCKHLNVTKSQELKDKKIKEKQELKDKKIKEKQELKLQKLKEKQELKYKNKITNDENIITNDENIIIGQSNIKSESTQINIDINKCHYVFKKGISKDKQCNVKINENNLCKKHNIVNK
jgi:hypothetical protein